MADSSASFIRVCLTSEIPPGLTKFFSIDSKPLLIANRGGEFFALDGVCPHKGFELDGALVWGNLLECPWHHYQYDLRTGENHFPKSVCSRDLAERIAPIATFQLQVRMGEIWVQLE